MRISINNYIYLELVDPKHAQGIFDIAHNNRQYLRQWLTWVDSMQDINFIHRFIEGVIQRHQQGNEWGFVIIKNNEIIGRIGVHKIDTYNKIGEIGYWIAENEQSQGIMTASCRAIIDYCFNDLQLNRLEIRCGKGNKKSQRIPEKLGFKKEGIIRHGEILNGKFIDLKSYSLLKETRRTF
jgi:ribosomal-protein-serine acetyltransferase